jgi:hypothetical protein
MLLIAELAKAKAKAKGSPRHRPIGIEVKCTVFVTNGEYLTIVGLKCDTILRSDRIRSGPSIAKKEIRSDNVVAKRQDSR